MQTANTLKRHAALVDDMAQARGVDLETAILRGKMSISDLEDAVLRCTGCTGPDACEAWVHEQEGAARETPAYCRNADLFRQLDRV